MSLSITFLGTGGAVPTTRRNTSGIFCRREGEGMLFDCGEGTQRQMMRFGTGFDVDHIFVSHLHADHILGIPGLLQTLDFNERRAPLTIYAPHRTTDSLESLNLAAGTRPSFSLRIRGVHPGDVAYQAADYEIRVFETDHDTWSVGYALVENDRKGRFDREHALELGVPEGPMFSRLHDGESVTLEDGTVVDSEQVVGDPRPGRRVVYTGDTRPTDEGVEAAKDADLLIHDATFASDNAARARDTGHSTATQAAEIATQAEAKRLALVHISSRYTGDVSTLESEAKAVFDGDAFVPEDGDELDVPFPE
ncbi:MAG: ribonuclease Z [Natronomonas sp.]